MQIGASEDVHARRCTPRQTGGRDILGSATSLSFSFTSQPKLSRLPVEYYGASSVQPLGVLRVECWFMHTPNTIRGHRQHLHACGAFEANEHLASTNHHFIRPTLSTMQRTPKQPPPISSRRLHEQLGALETRRQALRLRPHQPPHRSTCGAQQPQRNRAMECHGAIMEFLERSVIARLCAVGGDGR